MRTRKATINIIFGVLSLCCTSILMFFVSKIFVESIGVQASGLNSVFTNVISILSVTELGVAGAINFNLYKPVHEKDYDKISLIMTFYKKCYQVIGTVIFVFALIASNFVHLLITDTIYEPLYIQIGFLIAAMGTVASYFMAYHRNLIYAFQDNYITVVVDFVIKVVFSLSQIFCLLKFHNYYLFLLLNFLQNVIGNLIICFISKRSYPEVKLNIKQKDKVLERKVMSDVKSLAIIQVAAALINSTDSILISKILGIVIAGIYSFYAQIINILLSVINTIFNSLGASLGNLLAEDNKDNSRRVMNILIYFCFFLGIIFASGVAGLMLTFIEFWVGKDFIIDFSVVLILSINLYIYVQRQVVTYYMRTGGYHKELVIPLIIEAVINLVVSIIMANIIGLAGIFIGTMISALYGWFNNSRSLCKIFEMKYKDYITQQMVFMLILLVQLFISKGVIDNINLALPGLINVLIIGIISVVLPIFIIVYMIFTRKELTFIKDKFLKNIS